MSISNLLGSNDYNLVCQSLDVSNNVDIGGNLQLSGTFNGGSLPPPSASFLPATDNSVALGSPSLQFDDCYLGTQLVISSTSDQLVFSDGGGANVTNVSVPAPSAPRNYSIKDLGVDGSFLMVDGSGSIVTPITSITQVGNINDNTGATWFSTGVIACGTQMNTPNINLQGATNQITFTQSSPSTNVSLVINAPSTASPQTYTFPDIGANGNILVSSGGSVTQLTSTSTAVTLNGSSGNIVCFTSTAAAQAVASFTVTNSYSASNKVIVCSVSGYGGSTGIPQCYVTAVTNGHFTLNVVNAAAVAALNGVVTVSFLFA